MTKTNSLITLRYALLIPIVLLSIWVIGCDDNNNSINPPTPTPAPTPPPGCIDALNNPEFLEENIDCPADALIEMCNTFACTFSEVGSDMSELSATFLPFTCTTSNCLDFTCDIGLEDDDNPAITLPGIGDFNIDTVLLNTITGSVFVEDENSIEPEEFDYICSPVIP